MDDITHLERLLKSHCSCISIVTSEESYALDVIRAAVIGTGKLLWIWSATEGLRGGLLADDESVDKSMRESTQKPSVALVAMSQAEERSVCVALDLVDHIQDNKTRRSLRDVITAFQRSDRTLILVDAEDKLPPVIKAHARSFELSLPDEEELNEIVRRTLRDFHNTTPIEIGISKKGYDAVIRNLRGLTRQQAEDIIKETVADDSRFTDEDLNIVLAGKRQLIQRGGLLEFIQTPLSLSEIGGMRRLKQWLKQRKDAFQADARDYGLEPPRGVLMLGVQGAGKSLCAKAIATAWKQPLIRLDPSKLYASYIGQSERNLQEALRQTAMMSPVILWIDEIEKAFASAASRSSDGGLSQRMFGTLLTWMQDHTEPVFVVATANDIEALPSELLRKGRFDEIFFVDLPEEDVRKQIFKIHLKKRNRENPTIDLDCLAQASNGFSGAEIEQSVVSALHDTYANKLELDTSCLLKAVEETIPLSVTMAEKMSILRNWACDRCVPADV